MEFPYISSYPLICEAFSDVRTLIKTLSFTEQDAYGWAIDAAREVGGYNYGNEVAYLSVNKHTSSIPRNFYLINEMSLCAPRKGTLPAMPPVSPGHLKPEYWIPTSIMRPADSATLKLCTRNCIRRDISANAQTYTLKVPPGVIRTSFVSGVIALDYLVIPMDSEGIVMVQDEINTIKCIKAYIKRQLLAEKWYSQELRADVWADINNEYDTYLRLAQQLQKAPDPAQTALKAAEQDARYRRFDHRRQ